MADFGDANTTFLKGVDQWIQSLGQLREIIRQQVLAAQLSEILSKQDLRHARVHDVGCGQGTQALVAQAAGSLAALGGLQRPQQPHRPARPPDHAPRGATGPDGEARAHITLALLTTIRAVVEQISALTAQITEQLAGHPDHDIFADKQLRDALCDFAGDSRRANPWAAKLYNDAIARGHDHPHAVRILARGWVPIIWRCWRDHVPYDPAKHRALQTLQTDKQAA